MSELIRTEYGGRPYHWIAEPKLPERGEAATIHLLTG